MKESHQFIKSDVGAQAAWKGFSSQTLYIASRIVLDTEDNCFYPEDIEDLVVKSGDKIVEAVQIKNISDPLTISHLSSTKSSLSGEGFFNRICSLHEKYPEFDIVKVVYFSSLGDELKGVCEKNEAYCEAVREKLVNKHNLTRENANWLVSALVFEKVDISTLNQIIYDQVKDYVETMAAPDIAKSLLIQHVSELSKLKGFISKKTWKEQVHGIGTDIASIDGYYKEYNKSLVRLSELGSGKDEDQLKNEFNQGISANPDHIRYGVDFRREYWLNVIADSMKEVNTVIIKGVSGQGKTALCYRYLIENYPEELVFCVRHIDSERQVENLVAALSGIAKHTQKLIVYVDVNPSETKWSLLIQEMSMRKINIPLLVSIREEDFNLTPIDGSLFAYQLIEVHLTELEAKLIYSHITSLVPHSEHRTFEESWISFGENGPLIEYTYFLTNSQTLTERLRGQIRNLLLEKAPDSWFDILKIVSAVGKIGGAVSINKLKNIVNCDNFWAAIQRFKDEYLIREISDNTYIEALHPIRATILSGILKSSIGSEPVKDLLNCVGCIDGYNVQYLLMDYFTEISYSRQTVLDITHVIQNDWVSFAGATKAMLWLDVKRYYERNSQVVSSLISDKGRAWLCLMPSDISGLIKPGECVTENLVKSGCPAGIDGDKMLQDIGKIKSSLSSLSIDFEASDTFILNAAIPTSDIRNNDDCEALGYSLFWLAKRNRMLDEIKLGKNSFEVLLNSDFQVCANAIRGIFEHKSLIKIYEYLKGNILDRLLTDYRTIIYSESANDIVCKFVPPVLFNNNELQQDNFNHYWKIKMLNILQQIFSDKEFIEVELLGVNLLSDFSIEPLDYKVRIPKENRIDTWITEINSWFISRTYYSYRPCSWDEYVKQTEEIRVASNAMIADIISLVDNLYKKQVWSKNRWDRVFDEKKALSVLVSKELLLPVSVVDKYCLYREDLKSDAYEAKNKTVVAPLLYVRYKKLKKELSSGYSSIENFFENFATVILRRIKNTSLEDMNLNLGLVNLFNALDSISKMQIEFDNLFHNYCELEEEFNKIELENLNIMLNLWHHIVSTPPKGYPIAYKAKQKYHEAIRNIESLNTIKSVKDIPVVENANHLFFLKNFDGTISEVVSESDSIATLVHESLFKNAGQFSSEKWFVDLKGYKFIYIPLFDGVPINTGFSISSLHIFAGRISDAIFPAAIDKSVYEYLGLDIAVIEKFNLLLGVLGIINLLVRQYNDISALNTGDYCLYNNGINNYTQNFIDALGIQFTRLGSQLDDLSTLREASDESKNQCINIINDLIGKIGMLLERVENFKPFEESYVAVQNAMNDVLGLEIYNIKKHV